MPLPSTRFVAVALSMLMPTLASAASWEIDVSKVTDRRYPQPSRMMPALCGYFRIAEIDAARRRPGLGQAGSPRPG